MQDRAVDPVVTHLVAGYVWLVRTGVGRARDFSGMLQVLYLALGMQANATHGGFFPSGLNGVITTSSAPATEANLS